MHLSSSLSEVKILYLQAAQVLGFIVVLALQVTYQKLPDLQRLFDLIWSQIEY